jgi:hypothetical protein
MGPGRKRYQEGTVDFFAVYLIPVDEWYIIPYKDLGKKLTLHFRPDGGQQKYAKYREAWDLLQVVEIQACVDPLAAIFHELDDSSRVVGRADHAG